jgi:hypothetical protein
MQRTFVNPPSKADGKKSFLSAKSVVRTQLFGGTRYKNNPGDLVDFAKRGID